MENSILFDVDSYKASHFKIYEAGTTSMFSYIESRAGSRYPETVFFGIQYYLKKYLAHQITVEEVEEANKFFTAHGEPFNYEGWMYIAKELKGKLPVRIRSVAEGTVVPIDNVLVSVESTDPKVPWIASWLETSLLRAVWYPTTVSTRSWTIKKIIMNGLEKSSDNPASEIGFKFHDFGGRGTSSQESAMIGDMAHLVHFQGTDTVVGVLGAKKYYHEPMAGFSIPASEHSTITSYSKTREAEVYGKMIEEFGGSGKIFACVSDSYDLYSACENLWGTELKQKVIDSGATVVIRPDSGHPPTVVLKTMQILAEKFGATTNSKGFKVLNNVRVIQGDGVNEDSIQEIINVLIENNFSISNIAFGCGGFLLQDLTRDTNRWAMKLSSITVNNEERDVFKDPVTDKGKRSKKGRIDLVKTNGVFETVRLNSGEIQKPESVMRTVFENGEILVDDSFSAIRSRVKL